MASIDLTIGAVPSFYREVYDVLFPNVDQQVDPEFMVKLFEKVTAVPSKTLATIWNLVDSKQGFLSRSGLYEGLALTALAQQGKSINDKSLENFAEADLPKPSLGELHELKLISVRLRNQLSPFKLNVTFQELNQIDDIRIEVVPEKKGMILKHVEYEILSKRYNTTRHRRYNDFLTLHELLLTKYACRMIPRLPPKKIVGANARFIEQRKKALNRFMLLLSRHPILSETEILQYFITYSGQDIQQKLKEKFKVFPDEFSSSQFSSKARDLIPVDSQLQFTQSREQIQHIYKKVTQLEEVMQRIVAKSHAYALDTLEMGHEICGIATDTQMTSEWATGGCKTWDQVKQGLKNFGREISSISTLAEQQATLQEDGILEKLSLFRDMLEAYKDLGDRYERSVISDHQSALAKVINVRRRVQQVTLKGANAAVTDELHSSITDQESHIMTVEQRTHFSLLCIQMETQLIYVNMEILGHIVESIVTLQTANHSELAHAWHQLKPCIEYIIAVPEKSKVNLSQASPAAISR